MFPPPGPPADMEDESFISKIFFFWNRITTNVADFWKMFSLGGVVNNNLRHFILSNYTVVHTRMFPSHGHEYWIYYLYMYVIFLKIF